MHTALHSLSFGIRAPMRGLGPLIGIDLKIAASYLVGEVIQDG